MVFFVKAAVVLGSLVCLAVLGSAGQFTGMPLDQHLINRANRAMSELKTKLEQNFDCSNTRRISSSPVYSTSFKANNDQSQFQFRYPTLTVAYMERIDLQRKVKAVADCLSQIKYALIHHNNIIKGARNFVNGRRNVVVGSRNSLVGDNYWVFASDFHSNSNVDGVVIITNFVIEFIDIPNIINNPNDVIRCIGQSDSNNRFRSWWTSTDQELKAYV